jgi:nicotinamide-nucleotide amidase
MKLQVLLTGSEIMSGDTIDSNSAMLGKKLAPYGVAIYRKITVGDDLALLVDEINRISQQSDILLINGGLGPTVDDLTATALAKATQQELLIHPLALQHLQQWCERRQLPLNDANKKQAWLPKSAGIIDNPTGSAVGITMEHNDCLIICTPGIPSELERMLDETIVAMIAARLPEKRHTLISRLHTFGFGESSLQQLIDDQYPDWPESIELGFRAGLPLVEVKITSHDRSDQKLHQHWENKLRVLLADGVIGEGDTDLAHELVRLLTKQNKTVSVAESCTGGLIAATLTEVAGASAVFEAGFITYSNKMKREMLSVSADNLDTYGAVSKQVVIQMAENTLSQSGADYGVAVSGIAGPDGGSKEKPVGTVWIAWGAAGNIKTRCLLIPSKRRFFQILVTAICLDLIRRELLDIQTEPRYFKRYKTDN